MLAQLDAAVKTADHVSQQNPVWLLSALVIALGYFAWHSIRCAQRREDRCNEREAEREKYERAVSEAHYSIIAENTTVLRELKELLKHLP